MNNTTQPTNSNDEGELLLQILHSVRRGGYYDALPDERGPDYLDVDVAMQRILAHYTANQKIVEAVGQEKYHLAGIGDPYVEHPYEYGYNRALEEILQKLNLEQSEEKN